MQNLYIYVSRVFTTALHIFIPVNHFIDRSILLHVVISSGSLENGSLLKFYRVYLRKHDAFFRKNLLESRKKKLLDRILLNGKQSLLSF